MRPRSVLLRIGGGIFAAAALAVLVIGGLVTVFTGFGPEANEDPTTAMSFALLTVVGVAVFVAAAIAAVRWARGPSRAAGAIVVAAAALVVGGVAVVINLLTA